MPEISLADRLTRRKVIRVAGAGVLVAGVHGLGYAQTPYPSKPVRVIVPFPAGGGADTLARLVLARAGNHLGQTFIVENVSGAGGNLGSVKAAMAEPDGYTVLYGTNGTLGINQTLYAKPGFDPLRDFVPLVRLTEIPLVAVVQQGGAIKNLAGLVQMAKEKPGSLSYASAGSGTTSHLSMELLKAQLGLDIKHIPYRGGAAAITDLIGERVDVMIEVIPNILPHVQSGRLRALATTTSLRLASLPQVPTFAEAGVAGFEVSAWDGLLVPAGTPPAVRTALARAVREAFAEPEMLRQLASRGTVPSLLAGDEFGGFIRREADRWGRAVKASGAAVD